MNTTNDGIIDATGIPGMPNGPDVEKVYVFHRDADIPLKPLLPASLPEPVYTVSEEISDSWARLPATNDAAQQPTPPPSLPEPVTAETIPQEYRTALLEYRVNYTIRARYTLAEAINVRDAQIKAYYQAREAELLASSSQALWDRVQQNIVLQQQVQQLREALRFCEVNAHWQLGGLNTIYRNHMALADTEGHKTVRGMVENLSMLASTSSKALAATAPTQKGGSNA